MNIQIIPVSDRRTENTFVHLPWKIYKNDPFWVPPLLIDARSWFSPQHPFYEYGTMQCFLAVSGDDVLGRIAAIENPLFNEHHEAEPTGFFGFFECIDDAAVARQLFETAASWLRARGYRQMHGPASPSSNYDYGLLLEGFADAPRVMMTYNPPYYEKLLQMNGFTLVKRLFAYKIDAQKAVNNERLKRGAAIVQQRSRVTIRQLNKKKIAEEMQIVKRIYNEAWEANYGHVPFTEREIDKMGKDLKLLVDEDLLLFAEIDGVAVGKGLAIRDFYFVQQQMNGRLFPFQFLKLFTQRKNITWARVLTLGVVPEYRNKGIDVLLCYELLKAAVKRGILYGEGSWILEDNLMMNRAMRNFFGEVYKTYGVFEKEL